MHRKRSYTVHFLRQGGAEQEVGVKQQCVGFGHRSVFDALDADRLARREADHGFVVKVVFRFPVIDGTSHRLFQEQCVEAKRHLVCRLVFRTVEMRDADQWVSGLKAEETVVLFDGVCLNYFHRVGSSVICRQKYAFLQEDKNASAL